MYDIAVRESNVKAVAKNLEMGKNNKPEKTIPNYLYIFENDNNLKDIVRYNELSMSAENSRTGKIWNDQDDSLLKAYIEDRYKLRSNECYFDAFNIVCFKNSYNPIKTLLESHQWDGQERISGIFQKYLGCRNNDYTKEVARLVFTGGIARLYNNGCKFDFMPIFKGEQGSGKSSFIRWLALNDSWFKEVNEIDGQEGKEALDGAWICEISELLALTKSKEVEAVKSFITRQNDNYRKPYERRITDNPRKCIFIGTTNRTQFLTDATGNRRFLPIETHCNGYDLYDREKECKEDILQCWLEAKHNYDNGNYSLVANKAIIDIIKEEQANCVEDDWRIGVIDKYLKDKDKTCVKDIWDNAFEHNSVITKKDSNDIVAIFDNFFRDEWVKSKSIRFDKYGTQRGWKRKPSSKLILVDNDDELPF